LDDLLDFQVVDTKDVAGVLNLNARVRFRKLNPGARVEASNVKRG
jgi:hypothetical protein